MKEVKEIIRNFLIGESALKKCTEHSNTDN